MKEYTVFAAISVVVTILIDRITGVSLLKNKKFWVYFMLFVILMIIVNGFITGAGIVRYNPKMILGIKYGTIPLEDFLFNFSLVTLTIVSWEFFKKKMRS
ncbi:MAG: lycopene cyclase domain-containing protein [Candidatus Omnitrophica bacterium]|nr:lycopene cyclase domain-containing protein [Candidatus Omnitrophota bacterium]